MNFKTGDEVEVIEKLPIPAGSMFDTPNIGARGIILGTEEAGPSFARSLLYKVLINSNEGGAVPGAQYLMPSYALRPSGGSIVQKDTEIKPRTPTWQKIAYDSYSELYRFPLEGGGWLYKSIDRQGDKFGVGLVYVRKGDE